jgi:hypothetical protein
MKQVSEYFSSSSSLTSKKLLEMLGPALQEGYIKELTRENMESNKQLNPFVGKFKTIDDLWDVDPTVLSVSYILPFFAHRRTLSLPVCTLCFEYFWQFERSTLGAASKASSPNSVPQTEEDIMLAIQMHCLCCMHRKTSQRRLGCSAYPDP